MSSSQSSMHFRKSQAVDRDDDDDDEDEAEPITSSQFQNDFINTLKQAGVKFTKPILTVPDPMAVRKELTKVLPKDSQALHEFVTAFKALIESDETEMKRFLIPFKRHAKSHESLTYNPYTSDSLVKLLLNVSTLQPLLMDALLERVPVYDQDEDLDMDSTSLTDNIPRLILSQFRLLDEIVNSDKLCTKIVEVLQPCSTELKKEIISFIPEIIDDVNHKNVAEDLLNISKEDRTYLSCVLDALSNMHLSDSILEEQMGEIYDMLGKADPTDLPVAIRFILQSSNGQERIDRGISEIRQNLDVGLFAAEDEEENDYSSMKRILSSGLSRKRKQAEDTVNKNLIYVLESLRTGIRYKREVQKGFMNAITKVQEPGDLKIIDIWVLIIIFSMDNYKREADVLFKKKIKDSTLTLELLEQSISSFSEALQPYFNSMNVLAGTWMRHTDPRVREFGMFFYSIMYTCFKNDTIRQELLQSLVIHIGSRNRDQVDGSLEVLIHISKNNLKSLRTLSTFIQSLIEQAEYLTDNQLRFVFQLFCTLAYTKIPHSDEPEDNGFDTRKKIVNDLTGIINKRLPRPNVFDKKIGILCCCYLFAMQGSVQGLHDMSSSSSSNSSSMMEYKQMNSNQPPMSQPSNHHHHHHEQRLSEQEFDEVTELWTKIIRYCHKSPICLSFLYDELTYIIKSKQLDKRFLILINDNVVGKWSRILYNGVQINEWKVPKRIEHLSAESWAAIENVQSEQEGEDKTIVGILPTLASSSDEGTHAYEKMWNTFAEFRLLKAIDSKQQSYTTLRRHQQDDDDSEIQDDDEEGEASQWDVLLTSAICMYPWDLRNQLSTLSTQEKEMICLCLFSGINWLRELINGFCTPSKSSSSSMINTRHVQLIMLRLESIQKMEKLLDESLNNFSEFGLPQINVHLEQNIVSKKTTTVKKKKSVTKKTTVKKKKKNVEEELDEDGNPILPDDEEEEEDSVVNETSNSGSGGGGDTIQRIHLNPMRDQMRELDMETMNLLRIHPSIDMTGNTMCIYYILSDVSTKLKLVLSRGKPSFFGGGVTKEPTGLSRISTTLFMKQVVDLVPSLMTHLLWIKHSLQKQSNEEEEVERAMFINDDHYKVPCMNLLLDVVGKIISYMNQHGHKHQMESMIVSTYSELVKHNPDEDNDPMEDGEEEGDENESGVIGRDRMEKSVTRICDFLLQMSTQEHSFELVYKLFTIMQQLYELSPTITSPPLNSLCKSILTTKYSLTKKFKSEQMISIIKLYIKTCTKQISVVNDLTTVLEQWIIDQKENSGYKTLTRDTYGMYLKAMLNLMTDHLDNVSKDKNTMEKSPKNFVIKLSNVTHVFSSLVKCTDQSMITPMIMTHLLTSGYQLLIRYMRVLKVTPKVFKICDKDSRNYVFKSIANIRNTIKKLQIIAAEGKKVMKQTKIIPMVKKACESTILSIKLFCEDIDSLQAISIGEVVNKDLDNEQVPSQALYYSDILKSKRKSGGHDDDEEEEEEPIQKKKKKSVQDESEGGNQEEEDEGEKKKKSKKKKKKAADESDAQQEEQEGEATQKKKKKSKKKKDHESDAQEEEQESSEKTTTPKKKKSTTPEKTQRERLVLSKSPNSATQQISPASSSDSSKSKPKKKSKELTRLNKMDDTVDDAVQQALNSEKQKKSKTKKSDPVEKSSKKSVVQDDGSAQESDEPNKKSSTKTKKSSAAKKKVVQEDEDEQSEQEPDARPSSKKSKDSDHFVKPKSKNKKASKETDEEQSDVSETISITDDESLDAESPPKKKSKLVVSDDEEEEQEEPKRVLKKKSGSPTVEKSNKKSNEKRKVDHSSQDEDENPKKRQRVNRSVVAPPTSNKRPVVSVSSDEEIEPSMELSTGGYANAKINRRPVEEGDDDSLDEDDEQEHDEEEDEDDTLDGFIDREAEEEDVDADQEDEEENNDDMSDGSEEL